MSEQHRRRLRSIRRQYEAAEEALEKAWRYAESNPAFYSADPGDIRQAWLTAEKTFFIRLVAETEGMLFRHLKDHWPAFDFDEDAARLLNHCRHRLNPAKQNDALPNDLAEDVLDVFRWRNHLAHGEKGFPPSRVAYVEAFDYLSDLLLLLPRMKRGHS